MTEKTIKLAAKWIYKHQNTGFWTFPILIGETSPDRELQKLRLSPDDASAVFSALEHEGFFHKLDNEFLVVGGASIQKYRIQMARLKELRKYSEIPFYYFLPPSWVYYIEKYWTWFIVCFILVVTAFLEGFVGKLGEWLGQKITG